MAVRNVTKIIAVVFAALTLLSAGRAGSQSMSPLYRAAVQEYNNNITYYHHIYDMYQKSWRDFATPRDGRTDAKALTAFSLGSTQNQP